MSMFESLHVLCSQLLERDGSQGLKQAFLQKQKQKKKELSFIHYKCSVSNVN